MLIAVAAVVLITLGLAKLFAATGDTVRVGRRVSALNEFAANMQRTLAADIANMSRKGFLVIRHREVGDPRNQDQNADGVTGGILLTHEDPGHDARVRRVDELVFFEEGSFISLREPLHESRTATGPAARVYYGHGLRRVRDDTDRRSYDVDIDDSWAVSKTYAKARPSFGVSNLSLSPTPLQPSPPEYPNRYASDWILLRHLTVLALPQATLGDDAPDSSLFPGANRWGDSAYQIGLQPAAPDIFRIINEKYPLPQATGALVARGSARTGLNNNHVPRFPSGAIDVAATDLAAIKARVLNAQDPYKVAPGPAPFFAFDVQQDPSSSQELGTFFQGDSDPPRNTNANNASAMRMKQWMIQAFPAGFGKQFGDEIKDEPDVRMNCELDPPDMAGARASPSSQANTGERWLKRADQMMLSASNFVPGCTEFIVEWSFGRVYPVAAGPELAGKTIWHGLTRRADVDGDGTIGNTELVAEPYFSGTLTTDPRNHNVYQRYTRTDGMQRTRRNAAGADVPIRSGLIQRPDPTRDTMGPVMYSCFGYVDPTFPAFLMGPSPGHPDPLDPETIPWPWPRLLRITIGLVDPSEPTREYRYQFVFEVPDALRGPGKEYDLKAG